MTRIERLAKARADALREWQEARLIANAAIRTACSNPSDAAWELVRMYRVARDGAALMWSRARRRHMAALESSQ